MSRCGALGNNLDAPNYTFKFIEALDMAKAARSDLLAQTHTHTNKGKKAKPGTDNQSNINLGRYFAGKGKRQPMGRFKVNR